MSVWLIHGDCLDVMRTMETGSIDAVVTDPPYNVGLKYANTNDNRVDYADWCRMWLAEIKRVCRGPIAVSVGQRNLSLWAAIAPPDWWLAWWKPAAMGRCVVGFNNWEPIAFYGRPKRAICDVIRATIKPDPEMEGHPCPKPVEWAARQVEGFTDPGDTVLDPFAGIGTTALACIQLDRQFIGCDHSQDYITIARRRIASALSATPLFPASADLVTTGA